MLVLKVFIMVKLPIYLDYQSTTPVDPRVVDVMTKVLRENYGNPHSRTHKFGWEAEEIVENARREVGSLIGADAKEIIFTSGATESNNLAIQGVCGFYGAKKNHIITLSTEHKCVINACRFMESKGFSVTFLHVEANGIVDLQKLEQAITPQTLLVSIMAVNNEIGVVQPLKEIGQITRKHGVFFHTDAAQGFGKIPLDVNEMNIDLMSISGHKIYGPKGIGALYVRRNPRVRLVPMIQGGGQERGFRSGTLAPFLCAGIGEAARLAKLEMGQDQAKVEKYFNRFMNEVIKEIPEVYVNGDLERRYKGNINISFAFIEGESMIMAIKDCSVSSGSACTSASLEPSYVIQALGVSEDLAHTSLRFGFGRFTTDEEIDYAIKVIKENIDNLRNLSPLWEMHQEGIDLSTIEWDEGH